MELKCKDIRQILINEREEETALGHICAAVPCFYEAVALCKCQMHRNSRVKLGLLNTRLRLEVSVYTRKKPCGVEYAAGYCVQDRHRGRHGHQLEVFSHSEAATVALTSGFQ